MVESRKGGAITAGNWRWKERKRKGWGKLRKPSRSSEEGEKRRQGPICSLLELVVGRGGNLGPYWV